MKVRSIAFLNLFVLSAATAVLAAPPNPICPAGVQTIVLASPPPMPGEAPGPAAPPVMGCIGTLSGAFPAEVSVLLAAPDYATSLSGVLANAKSSDLVLQITGYSLTFSGVAEFVEVSLSAKAVGQPDASFAPYGHIMGYVQKAPNGDVTVNNVGATIGNPIHPGGASVGNS